jgi:hypothetical protein
MIHYKPLQINELWFYTVNGEPSGACETCEGHATSDEAVDHYLNGLKINDEAKAVPLAMKCMVCGTVTQAGLMVPEVYMTLVLCDDHRNLETALPILRKKIIDIRRYDDEINP